MVKGASVVDSGSSSGLVSIAVSILGASSETLDCSVDLLGDFERPKDLNWDVRRRLRLSFLGVGAMAPVSVTAGVSSVVGAAGSVVSATVSVGTSPFVTGAVVAGAGAGVLSFLPVSRPPKRDPRLAFSTTFDSVVAAGVSSAAGVSVVLGSVTGSVSAGASAVSTGAVAVSSVATSLAAGSGEVSLGVCFPLKIPKPVNDLRFSFLESSTGATVSDLVLLRGNYQRWVQQQLL